MIHKLRNGHAALAALVLAAGVVLAGSSGSARDVPYVPTPMGAVQKMIDMAAVTDQDVVYDLGCGDGRIVITAAKQRGARGVGVDIDPERIKDSQDNAAKAGVTDKVWFANTDLFRVDFRDATVVMLYLLPQVNLQLRPILFDQLKPGTRIVSHSFSMGEWKPDARVEENYSTLYLWVMPANVSGTWTWKAMVGDREETFTADLTQDFQQVSGQVRTASGSAPIRDARLVGDKLSFSVDESGAFPAMRMEGTVNGHRIAGTGDKGRTGWFSLFGGTTGASATGTQSAWTATRDPKTATPIDKASETTL